MRCFVCYHNEETKHQTPGVMAAGQNRAYNRGIFYLITGLFYSPQFILQYSERCLQPIGLAPAEGGVYAHLTPDIGGVKSVYFFLYSECFV